MVSFTVHPKPNTVIVAAEMAEHLRKIHSLFNRSQEPFVLVSSSGSLQVTIQEGKAYIEGYEVGEPGESDAVVTLTASSTNHIYLQVPTGDVVVNTTGIAPSNSYKLFTATTDGTGVTATTDVQVDTIQFDDPFVANTLESLGFVKGTLANLVGSQPYIRLQDTLAGTIRRLWLRNGALQLTDDSGATIYIPTMSQLTTSFEDPVEDKDLNTPPGSPATGVRYIVGTVPTGAWAGQANAIAEYNGTTWDFYAAAEGDATYVKDEDLLYVFNGTSWNPSASAEASQDAVGTILTDTATIDLTYNDGTPSITADVVLNSIGNTHIRDSAGLSVIGRSANTTGDPADIVAANDGEVLRRSGTTVGFGTVATAGIADNAVSNTKIRDSVGVSVIGRSANTTGDPADIAASANGHVLRRTGDALAFGTIDNTFISDFAEAAQDAVGAMLVDSATIDLTYTDATPSLTAAVIANSIGNTQLRQGVATSVIGRSANSTGNVADIAAASDGQVLRRAGGVLGFGSLDSTIITDFNEAAQDAVGGIVAGDSDVSLTYSDATPSITAAFTGVATATPNRGVKRNGSGQASFVAGTSDDHAVNLLQMQQLSFNNNLMLGGM